MENSVDVESVKASITSTKAHLSSRKAFTGFSLSFPVVLFSFHRCCNVAMISAGTYEFQDISLEESVFCDLASQYYSLVFVVHIFIF